MLRDLNRTENDVSFFRFRYPTRTGNLCAKKVWLVRQMAFISLFAIPISICYLNFLFFLFNSPSESIDSPSTFYLNYTIRDGKFISRKRFFLRLLRHEGTIQLCRSVNLAFCFGHERTEMFSLFSSGNGP